MADLALDKMFTLDKVLKASKADDEDKHDIYLKVGDLQFSAEEGKEEDVEAEGKKTKTKLRAWLTLPFRGKKTKFNFSMNGFRQFSRWLLGIPTEYLLKCPRGLALENVEWWQSTMADKDVLIRIRQGGEHGSIIRAVLSATYGKIDNTPVLTMIKGVVEDLGMKVWRFDIPDTSMHVKAVFPEKVNMGTQKDPDWVYLGAHIGNSETGGAPHTVDCSTFRLVCSNGAIALVDGKRLVTVQHKGEWSPKALQETLRNGFTKARESKSAVFGKMQGLKDTKVSDPFEEMRRAWLEFHLPAQSRDLAMKLLEQVYTGGTRWDIVGAMTQAARELGDDPDRRLEIEQGAGQYIEMPSALLVG